MKRNKAENAFNWGLIQFGNARILCLQSHPLMTKELAFLSLASRYAEAAASEYHPTKSLRTTPIDAARNNVRVAPYTRCTPSWYASSLSHRAGSGLIECMC
jgi:hypothetical protein